MFARGGQLRFRPAGSALAALLAVALTVTLAACGASGPRSTATVAISTSPDPGTASTATPSQIGRTETAGTVAMKVTGVRTAPSLTWQGGRTSDVTPNGAARTIQAPTHFHYVFITTEVTNHGSRPLDLACSTALTVAVGDSRGNTATPVEGLDQLRGNPGCHDALAPGASTRMTYAFLAGTAGRVTALEFGAADASRPTVITL